MHLSENKLLEDIFNSVTHGIGIILSLIGFFILVIFHTNEYTPLQIASLIVFTLCLFLLYLTSTLSHSLARTKARKVFLILDTSAIYLLIAGTYTPFALIALRGIFGLSILSIIWILSILGIVLNTVFFEKVKTISVILYLFLGWASLFILKPLLFALKPHVLILLILGGMSYTMGVLFLITKKLPFNHTIWHLFVLIGSIFHYFAIYSL